MNLPKEFIERIKLQFPEEHEAFLSSIERDPITSIRYNPRKSNSRFDAEKIPWTENGFYLDKRPKFTFDPLFHAGAYYVQESSSMFIDYVLKNLKSKISFDRVLDLCASPGGKSTIVLDHLEDHQYLISNELIPSRNNVLKENLTKWGRPNFLVSQNKPKDFASVEQHFDLILLDAPCSGEGLFRKDKDAISEWNTNNLKMCSERQNDIFHYVWDSLKDGGYLVYSTCTYNPDENENLIDRLLNEGYQFSCESLTLESSWNIQTIEQKGVIGYQFLPHKVKGEGFFCTVLKKAGDYQKAINKKSSSQINSIVYDFIEGNESLNEYSTFKFEKNLYLAPNTLLDHLDYYKKNLYIKQVGIDVAEENHGVYSPTHGLAMLSLTHVPQKMYSLTKEQALQFLSKEAFDTEIKENGYCLVSYENLPLGIVKQIGLRHNNYYPKNWRILRDWRRV